MMNSLRIPSICSLRFICFESADCAGLKFPLICKKKKNYVFLFFLLHNLFNKQVNSISKSCFLCRLTEYILHKKIPNKKIISDFTYFLAKKNKNNNNKTIQTNNLTLTSSFIHKQYRSSVLL